MPPVYHWEAWDEAFPLQRDATKCVRCMRCVAECAKVQHCAVWEAAGPAANRGVRVAGGATIANSGCALCGQCITHCPTGALTARDDVDVVLDALADPETVTVVQVAPAIRSAWGEGVGLSREAATQGRMVAALRALGFDYVYDTDFAADLTIMEEASELLYRMHNKKELLPQFTSCCPSWVEFTEIFFPELIPHLSTAKSPISMLSPMIKTYFAKRMKIDPADIVTVCVTPCTSKKGGKSPGRNGMLPAVTGRNRKSAIRTTALRTREIGENGSKTPKIDFNNLKDSDYDPIFGQSSGGDADGVQTSAPLAVNTVRNSIMVDIIDILFEHVRHARRDRQGVAFHRKRLARGQDSHL